jgi:hypothetical protein
MPRPSTNGPADKTADGQTRNAVVIRASSAWKAWLERYARSQGAPVATFVASMLTRSAKQDGFDPPPDRF